MKNFATDRGQHQSLVCRKIELDLRPSARSRRDRTAIANSALAREPPAGIAVDVETELIGRHRQAGFFRNPRDYFTKRAIQKRFIEMALIS
jgi:hypothetical protein